MSKEKLNINTTPTTLFVGVGGIGSDVIRRVAERCREGETKNIRFVTMDTNVNDLGKVRGSKASIVSIQTSSTQSVLDYLKNDEDARKNWFPNNTTLYPRALSEGAGQVRAISRLALNATIKTGEILKLYKAIDELFLKDGEEGKQALRVVIASSAAGGTGSGIAMTVGMLIREYLHKHYREKTALIRGLILLPGVLDTKISTEVERESLRRNGYATIKEINAFMIKASGFCGVRKDLERFRDLHIDVPTTSNGTERLEGLPFDFCFLLDRVDQQQESMETLDQYKEFAAQSLYEQNIGPMQASAVSIEDNIKKEFADRDNLGRNRFGGIGASILRYPYEDVVNYVAYCRALERIGDSGKTGGWLKYDKKFAEAVAEFKKNRDMTVDDEPKIDDVYISEVDNDDQRFGKDIKKYLSTGISSNVAAVVSENIQTFLGSFEEEIKGSFLAAPKVADLYSQAENLSRRIDYSNNNNSMLGTQNIAKLRNFEATVVNNAADFAKARAKGILLNAPSVSTEVQPYHLESLLKTSKGCIHPNAVRYILYSLKKEIKDRIDESIRNNLKETDESRKTYARGAKSKNFVPMSLNNVDEMTLDDLASLLVSKDNKCKMADVWDLLNKHIPGFYNAVSEYCDAVLRDASYSVALDYLNRLCSEFERFYSSFETKVTSLERKKEEIVDHLRFHKGDSVFNLCGTKEALDKLAELCPEGSDRLMLPEELNAKIFDSVKKNAESRRLADIDPNGDNTIADIFDAVLITYFCNSVETDCDEVLNLNVVKAIAQDQRLKEYFEQRSLGDDDHAAMPNIPEERRIDYLKSMIAFGNRLASPGIGLANFNEPRTVSTVAYNVSLRLMRDIDVNRTIESMTLEPVESDTVSKYELRFFNALYNITPDKLSRFKSPEECKEDALYGDDAGIYYNAYHEYIKKIGPDSTKCATISLHIDKRWDSLTELPEISMSAHYNEMLKIHSALVYAVVHGRIRTHLSSRYDPNKRIYGLEDDNGDITSLVVSNNTECDEFYEVLDALYRDRASVAQIYKMIEENCKYDVECNRRYLDTAFFKDSKTFKIGEGHAAPTSLFEIPLAYYNSLPRAKLDDNELSIMIDSVMNVIKTEVDRYEQENDRAPFFVERIEEQFRMLVKNFKNKEYNKKDEMKKGTEISDNRVINMVFRKVSNKLKELNAYNFDEKIEKLRELLHENSDEPNQNGAV